MEVSRVGFKRSRNNRLKLGKVNFSFFMKIQSDTPSNWRRFSEPYNSISEELAEFKTEDEISVIINSILRAELEGELNYKIIYSYNPPNRKQSWVNKKF